MLEERHRKRMSYLPVSSNDTLSHFALPGSPETLCGKPAVGKPTASDTLNCDVCATLSGGDSILKQTHQVESARECPYCEDGFDQSGFACLECGGTGQIDEDGEDEYATDLSGLNQESPLRGTRVATTNTSTTGNAANVTYTTTNAGVNFTTSANTSTTAQVTNLTPKDKCEECGQETEVTVEKDGQWKCVGCATKPWGGNWENSGQGKTSVAEETPRKVATNWTRDGEPIENGFEVVISTDKAARTPFLDLTRVSVSEQRDCDECQDTVWLSKIASCVDCDGLKCSGCMETIGLDSFLGTCKKCAGGESDLLYEAEPDYGDQDRFLSYLMQDEDVEVDDLFLPNDPE